MLSTAPTWSMTLRDASGSSAIIRGTLLPGTTASAGLAAVATLAGAIQDLSDAIIERRSVSFSQVAETIDAAGPTPANVTGVILFQTSEEFARFIMRIPGFKPDKTETTGCFAGERINLLDDDVVNLIDFLVAEPWVEPWGLSLTAAEAGYVREES